MIGSGIPGDMGVLEGMFMDGDEKEAAILGEENLCRFLKDGRLRSGFCVLTDKRVYFKGRCFRNTGRAYRVSRDEYTIDLKDITASGFSTVRFGVVFLLEIVYVLVMTVMSGLFLLFWGEVGHYHFGMDSIVWTCRVLLALGLAAVPVCYYLKPFRIFVIEYVSGKIAFLASDYPESDMRSFQRELYRVRDACAMAASHGDGSAKKQNTA